MEKIGSGMNIRHHISEELRNTMWDEILKFFNADPDRGSGIFLTLDPGSGMEKFGSWINIPGLQHGLR
jgi:hypothetical protein